MLRRIRLRTKMEKSYCTKCKETTVSMRQGRAYYLCNKCGHDKSLSDVYWYEATHKN